MTATDELRRLLDERGVKYEAKDRPAASHADWEAWMHGDGHQLSEGIRRETLWGQPTDQNGDALKGVYLAKATEMGGGLFLEAQLVTPEQAIAATLRDDEHTTALMAEFVRVLDERDTLNAKFEVAQSMRHAEHERYIEENAKLQKQGARLFDKTLDLAAENEKLRAQLAEWKRVAESKQDIIDHMRDANAENAKLRQMVRDMWPHVRHRSRMCRECELPCRETGDECLLYEPMRQRMAELGIEVDA